MTVRQVRPDELSRLFRLTYDLARGVSQTRHVAECKRDPKLRSGAHFVLEGEPAGAEPGEFLSTATVYLYRHPPVATAAGIANLFTPPPLRRRGYAAALLAGVIEEYERRGLTVFYLLSDIGSDFYAPFGFEPLAVRYEAAPDCLPMLRCPHEDRERLETHGPFLRGLMAFVD